MKKIFRLSNLIPLLLVVYITKSFITEPSFFDFGIITLMSFGFLYKLKLDVQIQEDKDIILKMISSYKEDTLDMITQFEENYKKDFKEVGCIQAANRQEIETKLSTLNLALQNRMTKQSPDKQTYGWR